MLTSLSRTCRCTCRCLLQNGTSGGLLTSARKYQNPGTAVFERMHKVDMVVRGKYPLLKKRHYVLKKIEHDNKTYKTTMNCILTREIDGIGLKGTVVEVPKRLFRNQLYPKGEAVYASPENIELYENYRKQSEEEGIDYETKQLMRKLAGFHLQVFMNGQESWTISRAHLKIAFRKMGIILSDDNILMPKTPVAKVGEFTFRLQMNNRIASQVRGTIYPLGEGGLPHPDTEYPPIWDNPPIDPFRPTEYVKKVTEDIVEDAPVANESEITEHDREQSEEK